MTCRYNRKAFYLHRKL